MFWEWRDLYEGMQQYKNYQADFRTFRDSFLLRENESSPWSQLYKIGEITYVEIGFRIIYFSLFFDDITFISLSVL